MKLTLKKIEKGSPEFIKWYKEQETEDFEVICNRLLKEGYAEYLIYLLPIMMDDTQLDEWDIIYTKYRLNYHAIQSPIIMSDTSLRNAAILEEEVLLQCAHKGMGILGLEVKK